MRIDKGFQYRSYHELSTELREDVFSEMWITKTSITKKYKSCTICWKCAVKKSKHCNSEELYSNRCKKYYWSGVHLFQAREVILNKTKYLSFAKWNNSVISHSSVSLFTLFSTFRLCSLKLSGCTGVYWKSCTKGSWISSVLVLEILLFDFILSITLVVVYPSTGLLIMLVYLILFIKTLAVYFRKFTVPSINVQEIYECIFLLEFTKLWNKGQKYLDGFIPFADGLEDGDILAEAIVAYRESLWIGCSHYLHVAMVWIQLPSWFGIIKSLSMIN